MLHHDGDPAHALRTIQDLARLEPPGRPPGDAPVLRRVAAAFRDGRDGSDADATAFLAALARVASVARHPSTQWSRVVDLLLNEASARGGRPGLLLDRLFPPPRELGARPGESSLRTATRYVARPPRLLARYASGVMHAFLRRDETRALAGWRTLLGAGGDAAPPYPPAPPPPLRRPRRVDAASRRDRQ